MNTNFEYIDLNVGGAYPITVTSTATTVTYNSSGATVSSTATSITIPTSLAQNIFYNITGTLTQNLSINMSSAGAFYVFGNNSSGSFTTTVQPNTGSGVTLKQGGQQAIICTSTGANFANNAVPSVIFDTVTASSGVTAQLVTASSAISAQSVTASSAVSGQSVTASSAVSGSLVSGSMIASSATQVTGTSTTSIVTPAYQQYHESTCKAWVDFQANPASIRDSYNVSSVARSGAGLYTVTLTSAMTNNNYVVHVTSLHATNTTIGCVRSLSTNVASIKTVNTGGTPEDPTSVLVTVFGTLA